MKKYLFIVLMVGVCFGQQQNIAVFDFSNNGLSVNEVRTLTDRLRTELVLTKKFKVVERSKIEEILKEQDFQLSGCVDECLIEVGKLVGATSVIVGSVGKVGQTFTISARIVDASSGEIEKAISYDSKYTIDELLTKGMNEVATKLYGKSEDVASLLNNDSKQKTASTFNVQKELKRVKYLINDYQFRALNNLARDKAYDLDDLSEKFYKVDVMSLTRVQADELLTYLEEVPTDLKRKRKLATNKSVESTLLLMFLIFLPLLAVGG